MCMQTGIIYTPGFLRHISYPEQLNRVKLTINYFQTQNLTNFITPDHVGSDFIKSVHEPSHIRAIGKNEKLLFDSTLAVEGCITAAKLLTEDKLNNAFVLCRPPGHHAHPNQFGGFCYFNNAAITTKYLQSTGFEKILIVDWDAHHGDGTNHIFRSDSSVLYCSIHESPLYPGSGAPDDHGAGEGLGYSINLPVPHHTGHATYSTLFDEIIIPAAQKFNPDAIIISAGQDSHQDDPLTTLNLCQQSYFDLTTKLMNVNPKIIAVLEGGYNLTNLPKANHAIVCGLMKDTTHKFDLNILPETQKMKDSTTTSLDEFHKYW